MLNLVRRYTHWLHTQWPAGQVEQLPRIREDNSTNVPGIYVVGDLTGVPLLKFSLDSGARVVRTIHEDPSFNSARGRLNEPDVYDVAIIGGGVAGMSAAAEAEKRGLRYVVIEASDRFSTIRDMPRQKPIYTYPTGMQPFGELEVKADVKESLLEELLNQTDRIEIRRGKASHVERRRDRLEVRLEDGGTVSALRVVVAIGRTGDFRKLEIPGIDRDNVYYRLHDPALFRDEDVLVVGGGDSAVEAALLLAEAGGRVTLSCRGRQLTRPKPENLDRIHRFIERNGHLTLLLGSSPVQIEEDAVILETQEGEQRVANSVVFLMIGREAPLGFFRRSGIALRNDWGSWKKPNWKRIGALSAFLAFAVALYNWTNGGFLYELGRDAGAFPFWLRDFAADTTTLAGVIFESAHAPAFWYTLAYSLIVTIFGFRRMRKRKTPYIKLQTSVLMAIQVVPLFILPELVLPLFGNNGWLPESLLNGMFPASEWATHGREYWRAYGLILAWPLLVYNVFTQEPLYWWLAISFVQTFVLIPAMIYYWGKGSYCGWICSCGALAETLGDGQRDKMPHGPGWNRFNMAGQVIMVVAFVILFWRILGWVWPGSWFEHWFNQAMHGHYFGIHLNYNWAVDVVLAGMIGYGVYFWLSGRFWCRFLCPLAALMNIYTRFSRFRILSDKKKCISCNVCTTVCHQGIDVMSFAQRGVPMEDPQCVRCSACVQACPTAVLSFGQVDRKTGVVISRDSLEASLTRLLEKEKVEA